MVPNGTKISPSHKLSKSVDNLRVTELESTKNETFLRHGVAYI